MLCSKKRKGLSVFYCCVTNYSKMILWVSSFAWTQAGLALGHSCGCGHLDYEWMVLRWWFHSCLVVGAGCCLGLSLLVCSHPLWAFTWRCLYSRKEELKQPGLLWPIPVSLLSYFFWSKQATGATQMKSRNRPHLFMGGAAKSHYKGGYIL